MQSCVDKKPPSKKICDTQIMEMEGPWGETPRCRPTSARKEMVWQFVGLWPTPGFLCFGLVFGDRSKPYARVSHKCVTPKCSTRGCHKSVSYKSVLKERRARVLECRARVSHKSVKQYQTMVFECVCAFGFTGSVLFDLPANFSK